MRAKKGDRDALLALLQPHENEIYNYLLRFLGNVHDAQDICQETFYKAVRGVEGLADDSQHIRAWLFRIARNEAINFIGKRNRVTYEEGNSDRLELFLDTSPTAAERIDHKSELRRLEEAVAMLPEHEREVVLLRINNEMPFAEIADVLGVQINTALVRMHRATQRLKNLIKVNSTN